MRATLVPTAALFSAALGANVTLETTACLDKTYATEIFDIELNTPTPVLKDLNTVCGIKITSASTGIDVTGVSCQAFMDAAGTQPGSTVFTFAAPALIATNPVQEKSILCATRDAPGPANGDASVAAAAAASPSSLQTTVVLATGAPTGTMPAPSANGTFSIPTPPRPTGSTTSALPKPSSGAESAYTLCTGAVAAALAALFLYN